MGLPTNADVQIDSLGPCSYPSPRRLPGEGSFVEDSEGTLVCTKVEDHQRVTANGESPPAFEIAGPREQLFFEPGKSTCGVVTCGGLCPGLNNVIRAIALSAHHLYGVPRILGFRFGYQGLSSQAVEEPIALTTKVVDRIHERGGTLLGSSRGPQDPDDMVDTLLRHGVNMLFVIGGDGTLRGGGQLAECIARRGEAISVVGVPKTIDNDLDWMVRSFGFTTAVEEARNAVAAAHAEAKGALNGVGLVKLMGRHSGFIAAHAALASNDVNFCFIPEVPFTLDGPGGFLAALEQRLEQRQHAVVVVAEGAGQELLQADETGKDASGNARLEDIGTYLRDRITAYLSERKMDHTVKYIDPSYIIRSLPACGIDAEFCFALGQSAVDAAMAGKTNLVVGSWNGVLTHVPIALVTRKRNQIDPAGPIWRRVVGSTGQPSFRA